MLMDILREIDTTGYLSKSILASKFNVDINMIDMMVEQLLQMNYLVEDKALDFDKSSCKGCAYASNCNKISLKSYSISEKGKNILKN